MSGLTNVNDEVIGLIPAAGVASRLATMPCSKEVYPLGYRAGRSGEDKRLMVAGDFVLQRMRIAGIKKAFFVIRKGKWDIPGYFGNGESVGLHVAYLMMRLPYGSPYTLDQAWPFVQGRRIALGFPDVIFEPANAYVHLLAHQWKSGADIVLGLFPTEQPHKMDMVETDISGNVQRIEIKPQETSLTYSWMTAVWNFNFTCFMHTYLAQRGQSKTGYSTLKDDKESYVGEVIQAAIENGLKVESEIFPFGRCVDLGTPEDLSRAISDFSIFDRGQSG